MRRIRSKRATKEKIETLTIKKSTDLPKTSSKEIMMLMKKCKDNEISTMDFQHAVQELLGHQIILTVKITDMSETPVTSYNFTENNINYCFVRRENITV